MFSAIEQLCRLFPKEALKTFTSDRGKEFACYPLVENLGIPFFFADAYSSWQRGSNENANGLLREYFPKKTDLATISDEALNKALYDINHRPRKCLAYITACEALEDEFKYMLHLFLQFIIYKNMYFSFINLLYFITKTH